MRVDNDNRGLLQLVRPNIVALTPYESARHTIQQGVLLDANESPEALPVGQTPLNRYPDPTQRDLRRQLASYVGVSPAQIAAGSGSDEVIDWVFKVFCQPGSDRVAIVEPTYGMYRVQAGISGVPIQQFELGPDYALDAGHTALATPQRRQGSVSLFAQQPDGAAAQDGNNAGDPGRLLGPGRGGRSLRGSFQPGPRWSTSWPTSANSLSSGRSPRPGAWPVFVWAMR